MNDSNTNIILSDSYFDSYNSVEAVYRISEEFERDARRYNRAFIEEQEVSA